VRCRGGGAHAEVLAVDLVSATVVVPLAEAASRFTVSPDRQFVVVWNRTLMIVSIEGGAPRTTTIEGSPEAWLRCDPTVRGEGPAARMPIFVAV